MIGCAIRQTCSRASLQSLHQESNWPILLMTGGGNVIAATCGILFLPYLLKFLDFIMFQDQSLTNDRHPVSQVLLLKFSFFLSSALWPALFHKLALPPPFSFFLPLILSCFYFETGCYHIHLYLEFSFLSFMGLQKCATTPRIYKNPLYVYKWFIIILKLNPPPIQ